MPKSEKRLDEDGIKYTQTEFLEYYGQKVGSKRWAAAAALPKAKVKAKAKVKVSKEENKVADLFKQFFPTKAAKPRAAVVIATGIHQQTALYDGFAKRLAKEGFPTVCYDHRGFGRSPSYADSKRSMIPEWHDLKAPSATSDLRNMVLLAKKRFGVPKVYVFGHSLGGLVSGLLGTCEDNPVDGFILSNPSLQNPWAGVVEKLKDQDPHEVNGNYTGDLQKAAAQNEDFRELWNGPTMSKYIEDGRPFYAGYQLSANYAIDAVRARFDKWDKPSLVLRGDADIELFEQGACQDLVNGATAKPLLKSYEGMSHELIFEAGLDMAPGKNRVVDDIVAWLHKAKKASPKIKLTYFDIEGAAEKVRLAFCLGDVEFEDERIDHSAWEALKPTTKFGQLPLLHVDGREPLAQSGAMLRWAGTLGGLYPIRMIPEIEEVIGLQEDVTRALVPSLYMGMRPHLCGYPSDMPEADRKAVQARLRAALVDGDLPRMLGYFDAMLRKNGTGWFCGKKPTIADCQVIPWLRSIRKGRADGIPTTLFDEMPNLKKFYGDFHDLPEVKKYYGAAPP